MKRYDVEISDRALADMEDMYNYIAFQLAAPENAAEQYNRLADRILSLEIFPRRFRLMGAGPGWPEGLRRMPVDNYSVFFVVRGDKVVVTNVLYSASDIGKRLSRRH